MARRSSACITPQEFDTAALAFVEACQRQTCPEFAARQSRQVSQRRDPCTAYLDAGTQGDTTSLMIRRTIIGLQGSRKTDYDEEIITTVDEGHDPEQVYALAEE
jgi:hypothetical protein